MDCAASRQFLDVHCPSLAAAQASNAATTSAYKNTGPKPQRFTVADGQLFAVIGASLPFVTRAGMGAFATGYKPSWVADDPAVYSAVRSGGKMLLERSDVASFKRPAQPLELYEFEGCPFCKKVWKRAMWSRGCVKLELYQFEGCPFCKKVWKGAMWSKGCVKLELYEFAEALHPYTGVGGA
eukprot:313929-Chlamydomonas_euryale.AAC.2